MFFFDILLIGVGLSMDAFAVSVCKGLAMKKINYKEAFIIALFFGGFQALMPFLGYCAGSAFADYIEAVDHWIAFILLVIIGGKMFVEAIKGMKDKQCECKLKEEENKFSFGEIFMLAIATSIDALAVGVTFALVKSVNIGYSIIVIGITTFVISFAGVFIGNKFGDRYQHKAELVGGVILILIGVRILLVDLGYWPF